MPTPLTEEGLELPLHFLTVVGGRRHCCVELLLPRDVSRSRGLSSSLSGPCFVLFARSFRSDRTWKRVNSWTLKAGNRRKASLQFLMEDNDRSGLKSCDNRKQKRTSLKRHRSSFIFFPSTIDPFDPSVSRSIYFHSVALCPRSSTR